MSSTEFWLIDNQEFIGHISIRHKLTEHLRRVGGHIGYYIRPSQQRRGYGTRILKLGLIEAKKIRIKKVLITCNDDNMGSIRIIEKSGGILENRILQRDSHVLKRRYWIDFS